MMELPIHIQQIIVLSVALMLIVLLFWEKIKPSYLFFAAVMVFIIAGIITVGDFISGLSNESILSIFLLIFITAGLREHFNIVGFLDRFFGGTNSPRQFMLRMTSGVSVLSAFLNNTPIVALLMPYVYQWSKRHRVAPSKLLIPLSYAAICGGMITVIGTSTNLVLNGLIESKDAQPLSFFHYLIPGLLVSVGGILFLSVVGYRLLPNHTHVLKNVSKQVREYMVETKVPAASILVGKSISDAHLRNLSGIYLFEIVRRGRAITPVDPEEIIQADDSLFFAGETDNIMELLARENELVVPTQPNGRTENGKGHNLVEAVIPVNSEMIGKTLKQLDFREQYDAAVVAIHRNGEKLRGKIGEITMQAGDLLLISTGANFQQLLRNSPVLYLVSELSKTTDSKPLARRGFVGLVALMAVLMLLNYVGLFFALVIMTSYMVAAGLLSISSIKKELDIDLLIILIASLTFSKAIIDTGSAELVAHHFIQLFVGFGNVGILIGLYLVTIVLTTFVTHVAAVSIAFPIAFALGHNIPDIDINALFLAIAFAASASFHAPFSYQTNLMVYGPGGYKFKDYLKVGTPFTLIYSVIALLFIIVYYQV